MENSAEFYYEKLKGSINPGAVVAALYCSMYGLEVGRSQIVMFNRLIKIFDRFRVFFAVIDLLGTKQDPPEEPYGYIYAICKRRFEAAHGESNTQSREPLDKFISELDKQMDKIRAKKLKIPDTKGLEPDGRE